MQASAGSQVETLGRVGHPTYKTGKHSTMNLVLAFVLLACLSFASASPFQNCSRFPTDGFDFNSIEIDGCDDTADKCEFPPNEKVNFKIKFTPKMEINRMFVYLATRQIPKKGGTTYYPIDDEEACDVLDCPLKVGQEYTYTSKFTVESSTTCPIDIEGELKFDDFPNAKFNCIKLKAVQKSPTITEELRKTGENIPNDIPNAQINCIKLEAEQKSPKITKELRETGENIPH